MRVVFTASAARDVGSIIEYIRQGDPAAAEEVYRAIGAATARLADFPELGHAGRLPRTRELLLANLPYVIVHQVAEDVVTIVAVFHGARDLAQALEERRKSMRNRQDKQTNRRN